MRVYIVLFFLFTFQCGFAQAPAMFHLDDRDGLPDVEFYDVMEDAEGFIWLAADKGLYRYDGKEFKQFASDEQRGRSVFYITQDEKGTIWCNNLAGQFFYVTDSGLEMFVDLRPQLNGELSNYLFRDGKLLVFTNMTMFSVDLETKERSPIFEANGNYSIPFQYGDEILLSGLQGIGRVSKEMTFENIVPTNKIEISGTKNLLFSYEGEQYHLNRSLIENKLQRIDIEGKEITSVTLPKSIVEGSLPHVEAIDDALWVFTDQGVHKGVIIEDTFVVDQTYLEDEYVTKFIKDKEGNYWFTTLDNGVFVVPNINIIRYKLPGVERISAVEKMNDSTAIFGAARGKIIEQNITKNAVKRSIQLKDSVAVNNILHSPVRNISYISQFTRSSMLNHDDGSLQQSILATGTKTLTRINDSTLLNAAYNRASIISITNDTTAFDDKVLSLQRAYTSYYDHVNDDRYVAYVDNLRKYNKLLEPQVVRHGLESILATSITQTDDGAIWASTYNAGLMKIVNGEVIANYKEEDGLISNDITLLCSDGDHLWIVTDNGIQYYNVLNGNSRILKKRNGLLTYRLLDISSFDNLIVFTAEDGYSVVERGRLFDEQKAPEIYFTDITIDDKEVPLQPEYTVSFNKNRVQFSFRANGFKTGESAQYEYRLVGFDDTWKTTDKNLGSVEYASLLPSDYTFQVRSRKGATGPLSTVKEIALSVELPFWRQAWFLILLYMSGIILSVWLVWRRVRFRESAKNVQLKELAIEKQITDLRLENLRSQMNPHFIFNALNSIQEYIVLNQKEEASDYLGKFADLIRTYLDHSSKGTITIAEEVESLDMYLELERLRFEDKLEYTIDASRIDNLERYRIPTMLIQPYVENAIKHGLLHKKRNRRLHILFKQEKQLDEAILCIIEDNGVGREKARELKKKREKIHKAFATKATQERLQLINKNVHNNVGVVVQDLLDNHANTKGTRVILTIPYTENQ